MDITHITSLLGGIALFLYGMSIMGGWSGKTRPAAKIAGRAAKD